MSINDFKDPRNSLVLFELENKLDFLIKLFHLKKLPKVLMLSGKKGTGKFTLINHFLNYVFDKDNYDLKKKLIKKNSAFYKQYLNNVFSNIIYLSGDIFKNVKVDDVRDLKSNILKRSISNKDRFIILDDIEIFNNNSLNALLKIIEEPISNNYFILINNKTKPLMETIYSRSIELKIILDNEKRIKIIESLIRKNNLKVLINFNNSNITPGNFLLFNKLCDENKIDPDTNFLQNLELLMKLYKKNKDSNLINLILYLSDQFFNKLKENKIENIEKIIEKKSFVTNNIYKFLSFNLNQNSLINAINDKLNNG